MAFAYGAWQAAPAVRPAQFQAGPAAKRARIGAAGGTTSGEVRFSDPTAARRAAGQSGTVVDGHAIQVELDAKSKDGTKVAVRGLPMGLDCNRLKALFQGCGLVKFADVKDPNAPPRTGQVRFDTLEQANAALGLTGTILDGHEIAIRVHAGSKDHTKLQVYNVPPSMAWQELKDFFTQAGQTPAFCDVTSGSSTAAEVRYETAAIAQMAANTLNGSILGGATITVTLDVSSQDNTKLMVANVPAGIEWQELKDHFKQCGTVAFVQVNDGKAKGGGEVRFDDAATAQHAVDTLNGSNLGGANITVMLDMNSQDRTKLIIGNIPPGIEWQELKDHFKQCGTVAFVKVNDEGKGKGKGGGKGKGCGGDAMQQMQAQMQTMMKMMGEQFGGKGFGGGAFGAGGSFGGGFLANASLTGEVRYGTPMGAQMAMMSLNGTPFKGANITVGVDQSSKDGSKVWVSGVPLGTTWQELKEHMSWAGAVVFCNVK